MTDLEPQINALYTLTKGARDTDSMLVQVYYHVSPDKDGTLKATYMGIDAITQIDPNGLTHI